MAVRPAWWIARAQERQQRLARAVEALRAQLREFDGVLGALIFGSYARGTVGPDSDLDIIVVRTTELPRAERDNDIRRRLDLEISYDLITLTPEQFERLPREEPFYREALAHGIWLDATRTN